MTGKRLPAIRTLSLADWQMIETVAPVLHRSRLFGVTSPEQAMAIALKGYELGLGLTASFEFIHVIQGKPTLSPRGALALIQRSDLLEEMSVTGDVHACTVSMRRQGGFEYALTFTFDDAKRAGVVKADSGWEKYPTNMLRWRCIGFVADVVFPDVLGGLRRADELGAAIDSAGDVIEGDWSSPVFGNGVAETTPAEPAESPMPGLTLDGLVALYGAEQVLQATGGKIPATQAEVDAAAAVLQTSESEVTA